MRYYSDLKKLKLVPKKKQFNNMLTVSLIIVCLFLFANIVY